MGSSRGHGFRHKATSSPVGSCPKPPLLSSVYLAVLSMGFPPTQGRRRKKAGGFLLKTAELQSTEQFTGWRKCSLLDANCSTAEFPWGIWKGVKGSKPMAGSRFIWTSFRWQVKSVFDYRLCVLAAIFSLFLRGWHCFDNLSSRSLLSHLSDTSKRAQMSRSGCFLHCAEPCGPLVTPITSAQVAFWLLCPICSQIGSPLENLLLAPAFMYRSPALRSASAIAGLTAIFCLVTAFLLQKIFISELQRKNCP